MYATLSGLESIIQLSVALNLVFYSFKEIRSSSGKIFAEQINKINIVVCNFNKKLLSARARFPYEGVLNVRSWKSFEIVAEMHQANTDNRNVSMRKYLMDFDIFLEIFCIVWALVAFIGLIAVSVFGDYEIHITIVILVSFLLFLPIIVSLFFNFVFRQYLKTSADAMKLELINITTLNNELDAEIERRTKKSYTKLLHD